MKQESYTHTHPILPDTLESKGVIVSKTGTVGIVVRTSKRDDYGEIQYRLRYAKYMVLSSRRWTRDELQQEGCWYIYKKDADASHAVQQAHCER